MTAQIFNFGVSRVVLAHGVIDNAPCIFIGQGFDSAPDGPTEAEMAALHESGVVLRLVNYEGALSLLDAMNGAVKELFNQAQAESAQEQVAQNEALVEPEGAITGEYIEAEPIEPDAKFKSSRDGLVGYNK